MLAGILFVVGCAAVGGVIGGTIGGLIGEKIDNSKVGPDGFNKNGFDHQGYDRFGYNKLGYNKNGYDKNGFDRYGYSFAGYNNKGFDRAGYSSDYYSGRIKMLKSRQVAAEKMMQEHKYRYAIFDSRVIIEEALKLLVNHSLGQVQGNNGINSYLRICQDNKLLEIAEIDKLHGARKIGNNNGHDIEFDEEVTHNQVYFIVKETLDLLNIIENQLIKKTYM